MPDISFGALLRELREGANLTQEALAARSGLSANAISMLERGVRRSPRRATLDLLSRALRLDAETAATLGRAARAAGEQAGPDGLTGAQAVLASLPVDVPLDHAALPAGSRIPLAPNPLFVGRGDELLRIAGALRSGDTTVALGQVVAATGLGGLGKTQLAVEFVHRYSRFFAGGVFWLGFASADEIPLQVASCAGCGALGLEADLSSRPLEERVKLVMGAWQSPVPRLLVFDNCEEESLLEAWRPTSGGCRVLVTSRRSHWSPTLGVTALPLGLLPRRDSVELLRRYRPDLAPGDPRLDAIAGRLGDLPLALHLAGRYLLAYRSEVNLDDYLAELDQPELIQHASLLGADLDDSPSPTHHVESLAQTFVLCLGRLNREHEVDQVAIALLARMAWMAPGEAVPRDLLGRTLEEVSPRRRADGLRRLGSVGLVEEGEGWLRLHRLLVHFVRQEGLDPDAQAAVDRALVETGTTVWKGNLTGSALAALIPHLVDASSRTDDESRLAKITQATGSVYYFAGDLSAARRWHTRALDLNERVRGPDHYDTGSSLNDLAIILREQGDLEGARPLYERSLAICEQVRGPDHPDVAFPLNNLGALLRAQGELKAARALHERSLAIRTKALGSDHLDTAWSLSYLGVLLGDQGEVAVATAHLERALVIREGALGVQHALVAQSVQNLGIVLRNHGELVAAASYLERALAIREWALGSDHPLTAFSLNDLATLLRDQGNPTAARPFFERALAIRERVLGRDHPDTVATRVALAGLAGLAAPSSGSTPGS
jgi:tetratricopeptide (TPR) repeat protein/transcriptional regulator with XRE-family HTH domain